MYGHSPSAGRCGHGCPTLPKAYERHSAHAEVWQATVVRKSLAQEHRARTSRDHVLVIAKKIYFTSYNIQNQSASHIDHKRLRGFALKPCMLREGQLYSHGNFVMGGLYVWEADICKV